MLNLKHCLNSVPGHDTSMILPRHCCHGKFFRENAWLGYKHDSMTVFPVKVPTRACIYARAYTYCHTIIFLKKKGNNYHKKIDFSAMTVSEKSIMELSWRHHGVMAEALAAAFLHIIMACLIARRMRGGAAC